MFQIVLLDTTTKETTPCPQFGQFTDGQKAAEFAKSLLPIGRLKYQPRPVEAEDDWRERERKRLEDGTYKPLPWADRVKPIPDHFAHIAAKDPEKVAFIYNEAKGKADIHTAYQVGSYLRRFYPELSIHERRIIIGIHTGREFDPGKVQFATTPEDIQRVYRNGPSSCMAHPTSSYASSEHPVRAYGAGDLAVAYLEDDDGDVTHRTICWPEKKIYSRIYSDGGSHEDLAGPLQELGYAYDYYGFVGAKLLRIEDEGEDPEEEDYLEGFALPYIDFFHGVADKGDHLVIDFRGTICASSTAGIAEDQGSNGPCRVCNKPMGVGRYYQSGSGYICTPCAIEQGKACVVCGSEYDLKLLADGRAIHPQYVGSHTIEHEGRLYLKREGIPQKEAA